MPPGGQVQGSSEGRSPLPFRQIVDAASDGVAIIEVVDPADSSPRLLFRYLNPRACELLGLGAFALDRVDVESTSPGLARHGILQRTAEGPGEVNDRWVMDDGRVLGLRSGMFAGYVMLRFRDVTDTERLEESERASRARLEAILASINDAFIVLDGDWRLSYLNEEAARILRCPLSDLWGGAIWHELPFLRGTDFERKLFRASHDSVDITFETRHPIDPDTWLSVRAYPSEVGLTVSLRDVSTDRRVASHAAEMQRATSLGTLAGGIAHDFNNLLMVLQGHTELLADDLGPDHPSAAHLEAIHAAAARAGDLTAQLLAYSQHQMVLPTRVDLNSVIEASSARLRNRAGESVTVLIDLADAPVTVEVDPRELVQSVAYLVDNARDAMPGGGRLVIRVARVSIPGYEMTAPIVPAGDFGVIELTDSGMGMSTKVRAHAAEPFFTHGRHGDRTGLGLSAADGIAKQAGGWLEIDSEVDVGTVVRIFLPCVDVDVELGEVEVPAPGLLPSTSHSAADPLPSRAVDPSRARSILVVDDNPNLRELIASLLSVGGDRVDTAADGPAAIALASARSTPFDLLVTDVEMPGLSGFDLAETIVVDEGGPAVLFMSGYTDRARLAQPASLTARDFIAKPFRAAEMAQAVERLLAERDSRLGSVRP